MFESLKFFCLCVLMGISGLSLKGQQVNVHHPQIPVMLERENNIVTEICIDNKESISGKLDGIVCRIEAEFPLTAIRSIRLFYTGTNSMLLDRTGNWALKEAFKQIGSSQQLFASPDYAILRGEIKQPQSRMMTLPANQSLVDGKNYFLVCMEMGTVENIAQTFRMSVEQIMIDHRKADFEQPVIPVRRLGIGLRNHGDDGVYSYRIPGLVTTKKGTLLAVYDVRYHTTLDLQEDIDVGLSRSTDGGKTWEKMRIIMDMGEWGGLPQSQNGIGDPCILADEQTGDIFVAAVWTHGMPGRMWSSTGPGMDPKETSQLMLVRSTDDGLTWSSPVNITPQVKNPSWRLLMQGPGRGITMHDGTLVFPIQYIDSTNVPNAGIMYSKNQGIQWHIHQMAHKNTTESQVAEIQNGVLMLNMRNNEGTGRAVAVTEDLGRTWKAHPTSEKDLQEPVCMASLLKVDAAQNVTGKELLLFSNPNESQRTRRKNMTIKTSLDQGMTWEEKNSLLIDEEHGWGYSCLTLINPEMLGILYEGSTGQLVFQTIRLKDIIAGK